MKTLLKKANPGMLGLLVGTVLTFGLINPAFLRPVNLVQYLNNGVVLAFLTFGLSVTIISGNFDYSVGSMTGFGTVLLALLISRGLPVAAAMTVSLAVLTAFGLFNGLLVGYLQIPGMLATLGTSSLIYGIALVLTKGQAIGANEYSYKFFGRSDLGTLPFGLAMLAVVFVLVSLLLSRTRTGRQWYLVGTSREAARFAGIDCRANVLKAHIFSAVMCFLGALVLGSRMASGRADIAEGYVLQAVTAAVFGGVSIKGGSGKMGSVLLGVMVFTLLTSGFTMINLSQYYKQVVTGILLVLVLLFRNIGVLLPGLSRFHAEDRRI